MANYRKLQDHIYIEQNIYDDNEIESYEAKPNLNGTQKTSVLYYHQDSDYERFYSLGILENLDLETITIIKDDLSDIFRFKTAKTRRKYIYELIRQNELQ